MREGTLTMVMMAGASDRDRIIAMMEIDRSTRLGSEEINQNQLPKAIDHLSKAYTLSRQLSDDVTERACAFNLGAAYITSKEPEKGLEFLQRAVPPMNRRDGVSNGDLYQNFALGYEMLQNDKEMVHYFTLALEEYRRENLGVEMEIAISVKLAKALTASGEHERSASVYGRLAELYQKVGDENGRAEALLRQGKQMAKTGGPAYEQCLESCMKASESVHDPALKCKILEDLGLAFTQLKMYEQSVACFEQELGLCENNEAFKERQAITLQNLGAVQNSLGDYNKAVGYHESASRIFGELGKRRNQGHCFVNMAYAQARLGDVDGAGESYLHALLAARDTRDKKAEWQAAEGLAAVAFLRGQTDKAIQYYKQALAALTGVEAETKSQERIVAKLTDALQTKVTSSVQGSARGTPGTSARGPPSREGVPGSAGPPASQERGRTPLRVDTRDPMPAEEAPIVAVVAQESNWELSIPPGSRDVMFENESPAPEDRQRKESDVMVRVNSVHRNISGVINMPQGPLMKRRDGSEERRYKFSLGIGEYESDSDRSMGSDHDSRRGSASAEQDKLSEEMDGMLRQFRDKQSDYRKHRPGTARNDRREPAGADQGSTETGSETETQTDSSEDDKKRGRRREEADNALSDTRQNQSLINVGDSWESDLEWKNQAAKFLVTGSATNSGTTDSSSPNRAPLTSNARRRRHRLDSSSASDTATDDTQSTKKDEPLPPPSKRPIKKNLDRRPIGAKKLSESSDVTPLLQRSEPLPSETPPAKSGPEIIIKNPEMTSEVAEEDGRLSVDSEGITSPKSSPSRHLSAVKKLRESFVDETGSEADEHVYAEIDPVASSPRRPDDPLVNTYEAPSGNYFDPDNTTEFVEGASQDSSASASESEAGVFDEEEEALYASIQADAEPGTSQTVFPSPSRTPRDDLEYTGPMEAPPGPSREGVPPLEDSGTPRMTAAERDEFKRAYQQTLADLQRDDVERNEGSSKKLKAKKEARVKEDRDEEDELSRRRSTRANEDVAIDDGNDEELESSLRMPGRPRRKAKKKVTIEEVNEEENELESSRRMLRGLEDSNSVDDEDPDPANRAPRASGFCSLM